VQEPMPEPTGFIRQSAFVATVIIAVIIALSHFGQYFISWLDPTPQVPYLDGTCRLWPGWLKGVWVFANLWVGISYFRIPIYLYRAANIFSGAQNFKYELLLYSTFIGACGLGHIVGAFSPFFGLYEYLGLWSLFATGAISHIAASTTAHIYKIVDKSGIGHAAGVMRSVLKLSDAELEETENYLLDVVKTNETQARENAVMRGVLAKLVGGGDRRVISMVKLVAGKFYFSMTLGNAWIRDSEEFEGVSLKEGFGPEYVRLLPIYHAILENGVPYQYTYTMSDGTSRYWCSASPHTDDCFIIDCWLIPEGWDIGPDGEIT